MSGAPPDWPQPTPRQLTLGGVEHAAYEWKPPAETPRETVILLHGWMDSGRTFAPLIAGLDPRRHYLALDWRGFGHSGRAPGHRYHVADYLADLDELIEGESAGGERVTLVGHSLGGNMAGIYAGIRPDRIARLISIEGFGLPDQAPDSAVDRYRGWLDGHRPGTPRHYTSCEALAERIRQHNQRLTPDMARFLAECWSRTTSSGVELLADPAHWYRHAGVYRLSETLACWRCITAPVLWLYGGVSPYTSNLKTGPDWGQRCDAVGRLTVEPVTDAGHAVHHEAPAIAARSMEAWW